MRSNQKRGLFIQPSSVAFKLIEYFIDRLISLSPLSFEQEKRKPIIIKCKFNMINTNVKYIILSLPFISSASALLLLLGDIFFFLSYGRVMRVLCYSNEPIIWHINWLRAHNNEPEMRKCDKVGELIIIICGFFLFFCFFTHKSQPKAGFLILISMILSDIPIKDKLCTKAKNV